MCPSQLLFFLCSSSIQTQELIVLKNSSYTKSLVESRIIEDSLALKEFNLEKYYIY